MEDRIVTVRNFKEFFDLVQVTGNQDSLKREIKVPDINRPGLELTGFVQRTVWERVIILGHKEIAYISTLDEKTQTERFDLLTNDITPCIVVAHNQDVPEGLVKIAEEKNFPVFTSDQPTNLMVVDIIGYLDENLAHFDNVHGELMNIFGQGILITGESGVGKSEIALDLINRGHQLVADDRVDCYRIHNSLIGKAPDVLQRYLEIRGVGILDVVQMFGAKAFLSDKHIEYIIDLKPISSDEDFDRLGLDDTYQEIMGVSIPKTTLPVGEGRNMAVLIESAVTKFVLKQMGINTADQFEAEVIANINKTEE